MTEALVADGRDNKKLGAGVYSFATLPGLPADGGTCPGATTWCKSACYAVSMDSNGSRPNVHNRWAENTDAVRAGGMPAIPRSAKYFRIHVSGDFYSTVYIEQWRELCASRPDVKFWAYTRSWRSPRLLPRLEKLRALPNVQLFASTDPSVHKAPPPGWRVASVASVQLGLQDDRQYASQATGLQCPEQVGKAASCADCGYCFKGKKGNVLFLVH